MRYPSHSTVSRRGFTLVELSIVLVILGLLVGGVLTGQSLIHAAELRAVSEEHNRFVTAINAFKDKYFAIPGDLKNATDYWTSAGGTGSDATCRTTNSTGSKATCNGNGDGIIQYDSSNTTEAMRFWQHLTNAGLIEGSYSGVAASGATAWHANRTNSPTSKYNRGIWVIYNGGSSQLFSGTYNNYFLLGLPDEPYGPDTPLFGGADLYNIDMKIDDGKPATGMMVILFTFGGNPSVCTDTTSPTNMGANYLLSGTTPACTAVFRNEF